MRSTALAAALATLLLAVPAAGQQGNPFSPIPPPAPPPQEAPPVQQPTAPEDPSQQELSGTEILGLLAITLALFGGVVYAIAREGGRFRRRGRRDQRPGLLERLRNRGRSPAERANTAARATGQASTPVPGSSRKPPPPSPRRRTRRRSGKRRSKTR